MFEYKVHVAALKLTTPVFKKVMSQFYFYDNLYRPWRISPRLQLNYANGW